MTYPLVLDLAATGVPVAVTCRVLGFSRQAFYAWQHQPVSDRDLDDAYLTDAALAVHHDDPEFGYRFVADELRAAGLQASERRVWRLCSQAQIFSAHSRKRGKNGKAGRPGPPVHDDRVERVFDADAPNLLWLTDIAEHWTAEGKLYLCAIKDVYSNRIVGYSISDRVQAELAVDALNSAAARRGHDTVAGCVVHSDRGSQFRSRKFVAALNARPARLNGTSRLSRRQRRDGELLRTAAEERPQRPPLGQPPAAPARDRDLDRADLPPTPTATPARPAHSDRV